MSKKRNLKSKILKGALLSTMMGTMLFSSAFLVGCNQENEGDATLQMGATWYSGVVPPDSQVGKVGDLYFQSNTYEVWKYGDAGWSVITNLKGKDGESAKQIVSVAKTKSEGLVDTYTIEFSDGSKEEFTITNGQAGASGATWHYGEKAPTNSVGRRGDFYFMKNGSNVWYYGENGWEVISNLKGETGKSITKIELKSTSGLIDTYKITFSDNTSFEFTVSNGATGSQGLAGLNGAVWYTYNGAPQSDLGQDGDLYLDITSYDIYKKEIGIWQNIGNIKGESGATWYSGENSPSNSLGRVGDFYLDKTNGDIYKYEVEGWQKYTNIKGQDGKGIAKVEFVASEGLVDKYRITFTDNTSFEFSLTNGADGALGSDGATWIAKDGAPSVNDGKEGDLYLDTTSYDIYKKESGAWVKKGNIKGESGTVWHSGSDAPTIATGKLGDYYYETDSCDVWKYLDTGWKVVSNLKGQDGKGIVKIENTGTSGRVKTYKITFTDNSIFEFSVSDGEIGESGNDGAVWLTGTVHPSSESGKEGDLYLNTSTYDLFKKTNGAWVEIANIKGESGATWHSGIDNPTLAIGKVGDYYFETDRCVVWEYKSTGWVESVCLKGDAGKGVEKVEFVSSSGLSDTYKITFTDGTFTTFVITNGAAGQPGENGSNGSGWLVGNEIIGVEGNITAVIQNAKVGDLYFNSQTCNVYKCVEKDTWVFVANLKGESGEQGDRGEQGEDAQSTSIYIGYDGYLWIGNDRTSQKIADIVGYNGVIDNTLELKNPYYFDNQLIDTTTTALALTSGYSTVNSGTAAEYKVTNYSHMTLTQLSICVDSDGVLEIGVDKLNDNVVNLTNTKVINVTKGLNVIDLDFIIDYDGTLAIGGGQTTVKVYVASGVAASDDYGVFRVSNAEADSQTNSVKDKLILQVKGYGHDYRDYLVRADDNVHGYYCMDCEKDVCFVPHDFVNGCCNSCYYEHQGHTNTQNRYNHSETGHSQICDVCNAGFNEEEHDFENAECTKCGYKHINHSQGYRELDDYYHEVICSVCSVVLTMGEHEYTSSSCGVCIYCNYAHKNHEDYKYEQVDGEKHYVECYVCKYAYRVEDHDFTQGAFVDDFHHGTICNACCYVATVSEHTYENGVCTVCEHEHTNHSYNSSTNGHCEVCGLMHTDHEPSSVMFFYDDGHANICIICDSLYSFEDHDIYYYNIDHENNHNKSCRICGWTVDDAHSFENGVCTVCNYAHINHEYETEYSFDETDHYYKCSVCGEKSSIATHTFDKDAKTGKCVECGYECVNHVFYDYERTATHHISICDTCGVGYLEEEHIFENGKCTVCEYEHVSHSYSSATVEEYDDDYHYLKCEICGKLSEGIAHIWNYSPYVEEHLKYCTNGCPAGGYEQCSYENGVCTVCSGEHPCDHINQYEYVSVDDCKHSKLCSVCDKEKSMSDHEFENGVCKLCEYEHGCRSYLYTKIDESTHTAVCQHCGKVTTGNHTEETSEYKQALDEGGSSCINYHYLECGCGYKFENEDHTFDGGRCRQCGFNALVYDGHMYTNGYCEGCKYTHDCEEVSNAKYVWASKYNHELKCPCGAVLGLEYHNFSKGICVDCGSGHDEEHTYENGVCTFCKYEHTNHTYQYGCCSVCGYACNHPSEYESYEADENDLEYHYLVCEKCGYRYDKEEHSPTDFIPTGSSYSTVAGTHHKYCIPCGLVVVTQVHNFSQETGTCTECGATHNCTGGAEEAELRIYEYKDDGYHTVTCSVCLNYLGTDVHVYEDGACEDCGYEHTNHQFYEQFVHTDERIHITFCNICKYYLEEEHDYLSGYCAICVHEHDCSVDNDYYYYDEGETHFKECNICFKSSVEPHSYDLCTCECGKVKDHDYNEDWVCKDCGFKHEEHEYDYLTIDSEYCQRGCLVCGIFEEGSVKQKHSGDCGKCALCGYMSNDEAAHDYDEYGQCSICGYVHVNHSYQNGFCTICNTQHYCEKFNYEVLDENCHTESCDICGISNPVYHLWDNGKCKYCDYVHDHTEAYYPGDDLVHYVVCDGCGLQLESEEHTYENGKCSACEYEHVNHTWESGVCKDCGISHEKHVLTYENISDSEHEVSCAACGLHETQEHNYFGNPVGNAKGHWYVCECGRKSVVYDHFYSTNQTGAGDHCQVCGFVKPQL